jgi:hypothetical protein
LDPQEQAFIAIIASNSRFLTLFAELLPIAVAIAQSGSPEPPDSCAFCPNLPVKRSILSEELLFLSATASFLVQLHEVSESPPPVACYLPDTHSILFRLWRYSSCFSRFAQTN